MKSITGRGDAPSAAVASSRGDGFESQRALSIHGDIDVDDVPEEENGVEDEDDEDDEEESPGSVYLPAPEGHVKLRPSHWRNILSTVFVDYPPELGRVRNDISIIEPLGQRKLLYSSFWERICIKNAFIRSGFTKTSTKGWTCLWSKHQNDTQMKGLNCLQKINHFQASWCIGRKDRLARTIQGMMRKHGEEFNFHPQSFILPSERDALHRHILNDSKTSGGGPGKDLWIKKPCASSCGQGIQVLTGSQVTSLGKSKKCLVQKYVADPYLIDGNKFDLRLYVVITGVDPLRVYIFKEGLTRISTSRYSLKNLGDRFAHLTNYSVNKKSKEFKRSMANDGDIDIKTLNFEKKAEEAADTGGATSPDCKKSTRSYKWSYTEFKSYLTKKEGAAVTNATHGRIVDLLVKTMIASESVITPHLHSSANYRTNCFELFGCDVMLDSKLRPHLVEVNISPSLMGGAAVDKLIKGQLIADILHVVGLYPNDPKLLKKYDDKDTTRKGSSLKRLASAKASRRAPDPTIVGADGDLGGAKRSEQAVQNPFAFGSMSKMMAAQDAWRRKSEPSSISMKAIGSNDAVWMMLLMIDDEFRRCESTQLVRAHPVPETAVHYNRLYFSSRFSDQLLAKWVIEGGGKGPLRKWIPEKYLPEEELQLRQEYEAMSRETTKGLRGRARIVNVSNHSNAKNARVTLPDKEKGMIPDSSDALNMSPSDSEPPLLRPAAARTSPYISGDGASTIVSQVSGESKGHRWAKMQSSQRREEASSLLNDSEEDWPVAHDKDSWQAEKESFMNLSKADLGHKGDVEAGSIENSGANIFDEAAPSREQKGTLRPAASHHDLTDGERSSSPSVHSGSQEPGSCLTSSESSVNGDREMKGKEDSVAVNRDRYLDHLLARADENLMKNPSKDEDLDNLRKKMIAGTSVRHSAHRTLLQNHPTLKGKDPVGVSNLPRMPEVAREKQSQHEDPIAVLHVDRGPSGVLASAGASTGNPSAIESGSGSRVSRHLRDTVRMQRHANRSGRDPLLGLANNIHNTVTGLAQDTLISRLETNIREHTWAGDPLTRTKKALVPTAPSSEQSYSRRSGVKLRSRSKPAGI